MMKGRIRIDFSNLLSDAVGEEGLDLAEWERGRPKAEKVLWQLQRERAEGKHPFLDLPYHRPDEVLRVAEGLRGKFDPLVILGIGGSSLGAQAIMEALFHPFFRFQGKAGEGGPEVLILDNVDPSTLSYALKRASTGDPLILAISKSGTTVETLSQLLAFLDLLKRRWSKGWKERVVVVTDPERGPLRRFAESEGIRALPIPPGVGGRFSVMTAVGLLPAALVGVDVEELLLGAVEMDRAMKEGEWNPALFSAFAHYRLHTQKGKGNWVTLPYSDSLWGLSAWRRQLIGESLGKRRDLAPTPLTAVGTTDQHSQLQLWLNGPRDKVIAFLSIEGHPEVPIPDVGWRDEEVSYLQRKDFASLLEAERRATEFALTKGGCPNYTISLKELTASVLGGLFYLWEVEVALCGSFYGVNPFDQPAVEEGKRVTKGLMGKEEMRGKREEWEGWWRDRRLWRWPE